MADATKTLLSIDGLKAHALRDLSKLTPGTEVIFGHVPTLDDPAMEDSKNFVYGHFATVTEVRDATFAELHPLLRKPIETDAQPVIFYQHGIGSEIEGIEAHRYATDSGVIPYDGTTSVFYNTTNFTVLLSELKELGIEPSIEPSEEFTADLEEFNSKVVVYNYDSYDYGVADYYGGYDDDAKDEESDGDFPEDSELPDDPTSDEALAEATSER